MKNVLFLLLLSWNGIYSQNLSMNIYWMEDKHKEKINNELAEHFKMCLHETDNKEWNANDFYGKDSIQISLLASELYIEGIVFTIKTDNLRLKSAGSWWSKYYKDIKGLDLLRTFISHLRRKISDYPQSIMSLSLKHRYYVNYKLPNNKELYFSYFNYTNEQEPAYFKLQKLEYYKFNDTKAGARKKKNVRALHGQYSEFDFVDLESSNWGDFGNDYHIFPSSFFNYVNDCAELSEEN